MLRVGPTTKNNRKNPGSNESSNGLQAKTPDQNVRNVASYTQLRNNTSYSNLKTISSAENNTKSNDKAINRPNVMSHWKVVKNVSLVQHIRGQSKT